MKRFFALILILCISFPMISGCFSDEKDSPPKSEGTTDPISVEESSQKQTEKNTEEKKTEENTQMPQSTKDGILKILTIGNSFSDDTMQYVYKIAKSAGVSKIKLGNLYIGGCTLDMHAANARGNKAAYEYRTNFADTWHTTADYKMKDAITSENWDFISLQQASGSSGISSTYSQLDYLTDYVRSLAPNATLVWNMTWAYQQDSTHGEFYKYESDQIKMYRSILSAVDSEVLTKEEIAHVVPNGTAIQNARTSYVGDTLTRDGYHLSTDLGRYIAGLTFFYQLTGISIENITFMPDGVDSDLQKIAVESAINAVKSPYEITVSSYFKAPVFDESLYDVLDLGITPLGYWNSLSGCSIDTVTSNHVNFAASRLFTREDIPVGSVIVLAPGWRYRPEAWKTAGPQPSRPDNVTAKRVTVTESWWGEYENRAFNISKADGSSLEGITAEEINQAFKIYIPKNN